MDTKEDPLRWHKKTRQRRKRELVDALALLDEVIDRIGDEELQGRCDEALDALEDAAREALELRTRRDHRRKKLSLQGEQYVRLKEDLHSLLRRFGGRDPRLESPNAQSGTSVP